VFLFDNSIRKNQDPNRGLKNTSAGFNTELHVSQSIHLKYYNSHPSNLPKNVYYPTKLYNGPLYCVFCLLDVIPRLQVNAEGTGVTKGHFSNESKTNLSTLTKNTR